MVAFCCNSAVVSLVTNSKGLVAYHPPPPPKEIVRLVLNIENACHGRYFQMHVEDITQRTPPTDRPDEEPSNSSAGPYSSEAKEQNQQVGVQYWIETKQKPFT